MSLPRDLSNAFQIIRLGSGWGGEKRERKRAVFIPSHPGNVLSTVTARLDDLLAWTTWLRPSRLILSPLSHGVCALWKEFTLGNQHSPSGAEAWLLQGGGSVWILRDSSSPHGFIQSFIVYWHGFTYIYFVLWVPINTISFCCSNIFQRWVLEARSVGSVSFRYIMPSLIFFAHIHTFLVRLLESGIFPKSPSFFNWRKIL